MITIKKKKDSDTANVKIQIPTNKGIHMYLR